MTEEMSHEIKQRKERSPWMFVSIFLGVLLIASTGFNFVMTANLIAGGVAPPATGTGNVIAPTTTNPTATRPSGGGIQVSVDDDPVLGDANAPVTVIEFSDFQCPFCRRSYIDTLPQLRSSYIDTGKVNFVYRDFPLSFHPAAQPAAEAAECADDQGKFWEMHDMIFNKQNEQGAGTIQFGIAEIKNWAREVSGLDYSVWEQCFDSGTYRSEVQKDFADGSAVGVSGTPTFFIGNDQIGYTQIVGAQPYSAFQSVLDRLLAG